MEMKLKAGLLNDAQRAYGSLVSPNFGILHSREQHPKHRELVLLIDKFVEFEETTDMNDDIAFVFALKIGTGGYYNLRVSGVGSYFIVEGETGIISNFDVAEISLLVNELTLRGFRLLDMEVATTILDNEFGYFKGKRVFELLFSMVEEPH